MNPVGFFYKTAPSFLTGNSAVKAPFRAYLSGFHRPLGRASSGVAPTSMAPLSVAVLLFPDFEALDVYGPVEVFGSARDKFEIFTIAAQTGEVKSKQGPATVAAHSFKDSYPAFDILLVPGGLGTRSLVNDPEHIAWIEQASKPACSEGRGWVMSVCTGAGLLAKAGVLNHRSATTNKRAFAWAQSIAPQANINWIKQARWVVDDSRRVWTSAGVSAGTDMALHFVLDRFGKEFAEQLAAHMEYDGQYLDGSQDHWGT